MPFVSPLDAAWLWVEGPAGLTHVTGVQVFGPPPEHQAGEDFIDRLYAELTDPSRLKSEFRLRPVRSWWTAGQYTWQSVPDPDLTQHVLRVRLAGHAGPRELHDHVGRFHTEPLDRNRPLWESRLIENLEGGGFALVSKIHHALFDGVAASKHFTRGLAVEPDGEGTAPWLSPAEPLDRKPQGSWWGTVCQVAQSPITVPLAAARSAGAMASAGASALTGSVATPFAAPATTFNGEVDQDRTFDGASASLDRLRAIARVAGVSTNDVVLTVCSGGLRRHLERAGTLPAVELTALVPVSRRDSRDSAMVRGNAITSVICGLSTDEPDPARRLQRVHASMARNKAIAAALDPISAACLLAATMGGAVVGAFERLPLPSRPPFNLTISTVPGNTTPLYWHGCRLIENFPASVVTRGQGLNLTVVTHDGRIAVGVTACEGSGIDAHELVADLEVALHELETVHGTGPSAQVLGPERVQPRSAPDQWTHQLDPAQAAEPSGSEAVRTSGNTAVLTRSEGAAALS